MKLSKSKLALAKVINENGGWVDDSANWAVQPKHEEGDIWFSSSGSKPYRNEGMDGFTFDGRGLWLDDVIKHNKLHKNWHQCVLSREEYYQAYPKVDADGWIEWIRDELPVEEGTIIDVKYSDGDELHGAPCGEFTTDLVSIRGEPAGAEQFGQFDDGVASIIAYRLHKPDVKHDICESVMRSIPETGSKPTIEQLAQDFRNRLDFANSKQQEADDAKADADAALGELKRAGEALGMVIDIANPCPELVITDWRDLKVGDLVEVVSSLSGNRDGEVGTVTRFDEFDKGREVRVHFNDDPCDYEWCVDWKFIRRP